MIPLCGSVGTDLSWQDLRKSHECRCWESWRFGPTHEPPDYPRLLQEALWVQRSVYRPHPALGAETRHSAEALHRAGTQRDQFQCSSSKAMTASQHVEAMTLTTHCESTLLGSQCLWAPLASPWSLLQTLRFKPSSHLG